MKQWFSNILANSMGWERETAFIFVNDKWLRGALYDVQDSFSRNLCVQLNFLWFVLPVNFKEEFTFFFHFFSFRDFPPGN